MLGLRRRPVGEHPERCGQTHLSRPAHRQLHRRLPSAIARAALRRDAETLVRRSCVTPMAAGGQIVNLERCNRHARGAIQRDSKTGLTVHRRSSSPPSAPSPRWGIGLVAIGSLSSLSQCTTGSSLRNRYRTRDCCRSLRSRLSGQRHLCWSCQMYP